MSIVMEDVRLEFAGYVRVDEEDSSAVLTEFVCKLPQDEQRRGYHFANIYDLFTLDDFIHSIDKGCFIPDDGCIAGVVLKKDNQWYGSNISIDHGSFYDNHGVPLTKEELSSIKKTSNYEVFVNWANK